jgi:hypothetical protein
VFGNKGMIAACFNRRLVSLAKKSATAMSRDANLGV